MLQSCASSCCIYCWSWVFLITIIATIHITRSISTILNISIDFFLFFIIIFLFFMFSTSWCLNSWRWMCLLLRLRSFLISFLFIISLWLFWNVLLLVELTFRTFFKRLLRSFSFVSCQSWFFLYFFFLLNITWSWSSLIF